MTSYNHVNGVPAGDSVDLCTHFARDEWGFDGLIMTDWNGGCSSADRSMAAGNDLIMPGGELRVRIILGALRPEAPEFDGRGQALVKDYPHNFLPVLQWNGFHPQPDGPDTVTAELAEDAVARVAEDGTILVNEEPLYLRTLSRKEFFDLVFSNPGAPRPKTLLAGPVTTADAELSEDGRRITYRGVMDMEPGICLGDLQRCAMNNLRVILRSHTIHS